jgi:hypothetical protein
MGLYKVSIQERIMARSHVSAYTPQRPNDSSQQTCACTADPVILCPITIRHHHLEYDEPQGAKRKSTQLFNDEDER